MTTLLNRLIDLPSGIIYLIVGLVVFAEDALLVGMLLPGETAAIIGGVTASRGHTSVAVMCVIVVAAAIIGDSTGYAVGVHFGTRLLALRPLRRRKDSVDAARQRLAERGGPAIFVGRFVAFVRAMLPFLAGTSRMPYHRFLAFSVAGGLAWGVSSVFIGYAAGDSYTAVEKIFGRAVALLIALIVVAGLVTWQIRRRRRTDSQ